MKSGVVHQLVHGYAKGHSFLAGSCRLPKQAQELVTEQSDLSGPLPAGVAIPSYLTAYPLADTEFYALGRTWPDPNAPRSGCVITHTLLIPKEIWASTPFPHTFLQLHRHPETSMLDGFKEGLHYPNAGDDDSQLDWLTPADSQQFVSKIFSEGLRSILWFDCDQPDMLVMAFARLLWPALRTELYANTFSLQPHAKVGCELQLHFAPRSARSYFGRVPKQCHMMKGSEGFLRDSDQEWITQLADDLRSGKPNATYSHDLHRYGHLLGSEPTAIRSLFMLRELAGRLSHTPMAAIGILDIIDSLEPEAERGLKEKQQALDTAIAAALEVEDSSALHCLSLVDTRLRRPSFSNAGKETRATLRVSVEELVATNPQALITNCGQSIPLEESCFWAGVRGGMQKAAVQNQLSLESLGHCPEIASFVVRGAPDVARSYLHAIPDDRESSVLRVVEWIHRIESEEARTQLRRALLPEAHDDASLPLLEELLRDLRKEYVPETLETLAESTQGFTRASIRGVVSDFVCGRFPSETIQWGMRSPSLPSRFVPDVIASAFSLSLEGLDKLLTLDWMSATNRCEVWSAFVERAAKKQLPQWFIRRAADDPALLEPFIGCASLSARAFRALETIGGQCEYIPLARSEYVDQFVQTLASTPLSDQFIAKTVVSAITEHIAGNVSDKKVIAILRLPPCAHWCEQVPADRIQDLLLSSSDRESWQRSWSTLAILPKVLFQRVTGHQLLGGFVRSSRALWSEEVAEKWNLILIRSYEELAYEASLRLSMESMTFCFGNPRLPVGNVVSSAFPPVYDAVVSGKANSITDEMFGYFDWDKAKKLRRDIIDAFVASCWPPEELALIASKCQILRKVFNRLRRKWGGDEYLRSVIEGLKKRNTPEALSVRSELLTIVNDPDFFEPWD
jgi:hypothetical protein